MSDEGGYDTGYTDAHKEYLDVLGGKITMNSH